jgi:hypothetical protein
LGHHIAHRKPIGSFRAEARGALAAGLGPGPPGGEENGNARGYASDVDAKAKGLKIHKLSGTEFRNRLRSDGEIPEWFAFPKVVDVLRKGGDDIFVK